MTGGAALRPAQRLWRAAERARRAGVQPAAHAAREASVRQRLQGPLAAVALCHPVGHRRRRRQSAAQAAIRATPASSSCPTSRHESLALSSTSPTTCCRRQDRVRPAGDQQGRPQRGPPGHLVLGDDARAEAQGGSGAHVSFEAQRTLRRTGAAEGYAGEVVGTAGGIYPTMMVHAGVVLQPPGLPLRGSVQASYIGQPAGQRHQHPPQRRPLHAARYVLLEAGLSTLSFDLLGSDAARGLVRAHRQEPARCHRPDALASPAWTTPSAPALSSFR